MQKGLLLYLPTTSNVASSHARISKAMLHPQAYFGRVDLRFRSNVYVSKWLRRWLIRGT